MRLTVFNLLKRIDFLPINSRETFLLSFHGGRVNSSRDPKSRLGPALKSLVRSEENASGAITMEK